MPDSRSRRIASIVGLAVGDALGSTNEFKPAGSFPPVTDMVGGGPFNLPPGAWTDDTSMAMCLAESLVMWKAFNAADQANRYFRWWREGYWSSTGECFDIGITTSQALSQYERTGNPFSGPTTADSAGNGSIMRLSPIVAWASKSTPEAVRMARRSSRITHGAPEAVDGCELLARLLLIGYAGGDITAPMQNVPSLWTPGMRNVALMGPNVDTTVSAMPTGYVVDTLACARWCIAQADGFWEAVLLAANLGGDSDTIAAVTGQLAGARWGMEAIPAKWVKGLVRSDEIVALAELVVS